MQSEHYYAVRGIHPDSLPPIERAARTLFLNRTCFNGLYRVNRSGLFNVPYGSQEHMTFFHPETLRRTSSQLAGVDISWADFVVGAERARSGDFVYLDPPMRPDSAAARASCATRRAASARPTSDGSPKWSGRSTDEAAS